jgi:5-hydroxyisourate hydrolase
MSGITTHVLDTSLGRPAAGIPVTLSAREGGVYRELSRGVTDEDGRVQRFSPSPSLTSGSYSLTFETSGYFRAGARDAFFERVVLEFFVADAAQHYHVPVLLSPFGYTTYRGS